MPSQRFTTVLPHEPLPAPSSDGGGGELRGYVHLQGAFVPRRGKARDAVRGDGTARRDDDEEEEGHERRPLADPAHVERTLLAGLRRRMATSWKLASASSHTAASRVLTVGVAATEGECSSCSSLVALAGATGWCVAAR